MKINRFCRVQQLCPDGTEREFVSYLTYDPEDPYAVAWTLYPPEAPEGIKWIVSRDHLRAGAASPILLGEGAVKFGACIPDELLHVELDSDDGTDAVAIVHAPHSDVMQFLAWTAQQVEFGKESARCDIDRLCDRLLEGP